MKQQLLFILLLFCMTTVSFAQTKFGKIDTKDFEQKESLISKEAEAEFISKTCNIRFEYNTLYGFVFYQDVHVRLKIYKKDEAADWADVSIRLYDKEAINSIKALTHNMENGGIVTDKLSKKDIFREKVDDDRTRVHFTLPNVKDGSILEWTYSIFSPYTWNIDQWFFQHSIPVKYSYFKIEIPEYFHYQPHSLGFEPVSDIKKSSGHGNIRIKSNHLSYQTNVHEYTYKNLPPLKDESFVLNVFNYYNSIRYELASINVPGSLIKNYSTTWSNVAKELMKQESFGVELRKINYFKEQLVALSPALEGKSVKEQMWAIFNYVKEYMHWNQQERLFTKKGVRKAFNTREGNSTEINFILTAILRSIGINANPLVLSTVSNGRINYFFPSISKLNHTIVAVEEGDEIYLMDASSKYSDINMLPLRCLNYRGFIIYKKGYKEIGIENSKLYENIIVNYNINEDGEAMGSYTKTEKGYNTIPYRENLEESEETEMEDIQKENSDIIIEDIAFKNIKNPSKPLITQYKFTDPINVEEISNKLFLTPLLFTGEKENPFKREERLFPAEMGSPVTEVRTVIITIPDNYTVESIPEPVNLKLPENMAHYSFLIQQTENNQIQIIRRLILNRSIYLPEETKNLKELFRRVVEKENEKIVLAKKN